jgi:thiol:disulfide interchange protein DsbD
MTHRIRAIVFAACLLAAGAWAQTIRPAVVTALPPASPVKAAPGQALEVPVTLEIASGYHINAEKPTFDYLIPTKLEWSTKEFKLLGIDYPKPEQGSFSFSPETKLDVYQGKVTIVSRFQAPRTPPAAKVALEGKLRYQACDDKMCYPPASAPVSVPVEFSKAGKKR